MARIRSYHPELCSDEDMAELSAEAEPCRRRMVNARERAAVARRLGVEPNETTTVPCEYDCGAVGSVRWFKRPTQPLGWVSASGLEWDHVVPLSSGGTYDPANIVLACRPCNRSKGARRLDDWRRS